MLLTPIRVRFVCSKCRNLQIRAPRRQYSTGSDLSRHVPSFPVRTRFAPSPTGFLHLGSLRTALFNYLIAKRTGGQFILRIEDTDEKRAIPGAEQRILEDLRWTGLQWDEGPEVGGPHGPYRQSERTPLYQQRAQELLANGSAYRCFCSREVLEAKSILQTSAGQGTAYDRTCYHISASESATRAAAGEPFVVRLKQQDGEHDLLWEDLVHGTMKRGQGKARTDGTYNDIVLLKTDGLPTYHLANVVDDHAMGITHVIRGVEWLISTPRHLALYGAFGWQPPAFAHVGLLLDSKKAKLSKRDLQYDLSEMKKYVLPEALGNFLALMGWSHKEKDDYFTMEDLERRFHLRLNKANPIVSLEKLEHLQPRHAQARKQAGGEPYEELLKQVFDHVEASFSQDELRSVGIVSPEQLRARVDQVLRLDKEYQSPAKFVENMRIFFTDARGGRPKQIAPLPQKIKPKYDSAKARGWSEPAIHQAVLEVLDTPGAEWPSGKSSAFPGGLDDVIGRDMPPKVARTLVNFFLRQWVAWGLDGPGMADVMAVLGKEVTMRRIKETQWRTLH